ncbi:glycosyltransferase family 4 protein [Laspinema sp. D1]|uniref:Glycosyltransferase family 4 protein n=1 Tax=Laspinema palackyanum D2a TaxID=2953684 RepID=A0ABT2MUU0_9CYAN|nr:glycosyltransferase family 4 protein [Laspinema sp. D2a]
MKILLIITRADAVGGAQLHVRDLAVRLRKDDHQVSVLTGVRGKYNDLLEQNGIPNIACPTFNNNINPVEDWHTLSFIKQTISKFKPDLVATHSSKAGILGRWASHQSKVPCVFTAHGWSFTEGIPEPKRTIYQLLEHWAAKFTDRIICVSEYDRQLGIKAGIEPNRLVKIHYGISDISPKLIASPGHGNPVRIVMVARFEPQKDHRTILMALQTLKEVELDLLGDGPEMETYTTMARELGIADRIKFLGFCSNVTERLTQYQIFALITNWEGFPISTLEAMRAGLPTVVSDVNGCSEAIIEGETGYCIPQGDVDTLRTRLRTLITDSELRIKMGQLARQRYEKEYTFEKMYQHTIETYQDALKSSPNIINT